MYGDDIQYTEYCLVLVMYRMLFTYTIVYKYKSIRESRIYIYIHWNICAYSMCVKYTQHTYERLKSKDYYY